MFMHELVAAPDQSERRLVARKIVKLLVKSVKEYNYALAGICCSVLTCTEGVPPPLEYSVEDGADGKIIRKLLPVIANFINDIASKANPVQCRCFSFHFGLQVPSHLPLTGLTSRAPMMRELVWANMTGKPVHSDDVVFVAHFCIICERLFARSTMRLCV
jgi:hypothetical protein